MKERFFDAVIFDLDGVITKTAVLHSIAWKEMFNRYLRYREEKYSEPFVEFTHENDYLTFVDGKPRYKGVADFLKSRGINIPFGSPSDDEGEETVCGLGNRKNSVFKEILLNDGAEIYESTLNLIKELKECEIRIGVASSSKNCKAVLESVGLLHYFETRVDGVVSAKLGLKGKPEPDIFTVACDNLGVKYHRAVVVEDAVSGVQAGRKGNFGLVIGVAREGNAKELKLNGADLVVEDIAELGGVPAINDWFEKGLQEDMWSISYHNYNTKVEKSRETLLTTGNGFFATRGAMEETKAGDMNYPANYMSGLYNRRKSKVGNKWIENEDFVNFTDWRFATFRVENGEWFDPNKHSFEIIERKLDFQSGQLTRKIRVIFENGNETIVTSSRFVSMADPHLAGLSYKVSPVNYSGVIEIKTALDGNIINQGVERYKDLDQHHLIQVDQGLAGNYPYVTVTTNQSEVSIVVASKINCYIDDYEVQNLNNHNINKGAVISFYSCNIKQHQTTEIKKLIAVFNNRDFQVKKPLQAAFEKLDACPDYNQELNLSHKAWSKIWSEVDVQVDGDRYSQKLLRLHIFHLLVTASPFHKNLDSGIPARGIHGEAYRGHIFWDELYVFPFYACHFPGTARSVLLYRYRRLAEAQRYAASKGYKGAMFPWQSGSDGREETQIIHLNPVSGKWGEDYSSLQRHISIAIAYNIWVYFHLAGDHKFLADYGAEMFLEICKFWSSICEPDGKRYSIPGVMGPDEFHEKYPDSNEGGLKNNAYTNIMVAWCFRKAETILNNLTGADRENILKKTSLNNKDIEQWKKISRKLKLNISKKGVIEQFEGYFELKELNLKSYQNKYSDVHRMDRILKAEGKSPDSFKMAKQADTLMVYYILDKSEVEEIIHQMGYKYKPDMLKRNFEYYYNRTSHGSTLSRVVHAHVARLSGHPEMTWDLYRQGLESDYIDIQGGTTAEGIHAGVMGGTVLLTQSLFAGLNWMNDVLHIDPFIPENWESVRFSFHFRNDKYLFTLNKNEVYIEFNSNSNKDGQIFIMGERMVLKNNEVNRFMHR